MINEIWKSIKGYEGLYEVSDFGRVKSLARKWKTGKNKKIQMFHEEKILTANNDSVGYKMVSLYHKGKQKSIRVHCLVAEAFIENPKNKPEVNHKDGVKANNFASNLEWATHKENMQHASKTGLMGKKIAQIKTRSSRGFQWKFV